MRGFKWSSLVWFLPLVNGEKRGHVPICSNVSFQITASADNAVFLSPPDQNNETAVVDFFYVGLANGTGPAVRDSTPVNGTFTIEGTYCYPLGSNSNVLELMVHGLSYNKSVWSGLGLGPEYDWQLYAAIEGYPSLAVDRLGHGANPQHPNPLTVVQGYLEIQIEHQIINAIRTDSRNPLGRTFDSIVYVSHSYAGWLATGLVDSYPSDVDALVLTGFSASVNFTPFATTSLESASRLNPVRFSDLQLGYITPSKESQRTELFYAGAYVAAVAVWDYLWEDDWTIGETGTLDFVTVATEYTGALYVVTGVDDILFCQTPKATCEKILNETRSLFFPSVTTFGYAAIENTGHTLMMHKTAQQTFADVHTFLGQAL